MFKLTLILFFSLFQIGHSYSQYIVDRLGGCTTNNDGAFRGTLAYCLTQAGAGETITFETAGPITHENTGCTAAQSTENHWVIPAGVTINGVGFNPIIDGSLLNDAANTWKQHVFVLNGDGITIQNVRITGAPNRSGGGASGIVIGNGNANTVIDNVEIDNNTGPGIIHDIFAGGMAVVPALATGLDITNCLIRNNGTATTAGSGIQLSWFEEVLIDNCTIRDNGDHGIYFEGGYKTCAGCVQGVSNSDITNNTITGNGIFNTTGGGITLEDQSDGNTIDRNNCNANSEHGIWLRQDCDDNIITNNNCNANGNLGATFSVGINLALGGCDRNEVRGNTCDGNENHGIYVYNTTGTDNRENIIEGNFLTNNGVDGIQVMNCTGNIFRDNFIGTTTGTDIQGNVGNGIHLMNNASSNEIYRNTIVYNGVDGIHLD
jgi:parallel beta-helix repeat protein